MTRDINIQPFEIKSMKLMARGHHAAREGAEASVCPVHALRNIDSDKEGKASPSFPPRGGTRAPGRGAESRGFGRAWDYTRVPAIEGGRHHTADWLGPDPDGPRAAVGLTKESARPSRIYETRARCPGSVYLRR